MKYYLLIVFFVSTVFSCYNDNDNNKDIYVPKEIENLSVSSLNYDSLTIHLWDDYGITNTQDWNRLCKKNVHFYKKKFYTAYSKILKQAPSIYEKRDSLPNNSFDDDYYFSTEKKEIFKYALNADTTLNLYCKLFSQKSELNFKIGIYYEHEYVDYIEDDLYPIYDEQLEFTECVDLDGQIMKINKEDLYFEPLVRIFFLNMSPVKHCPRRNIIGIMKLTGKFLSDEEIEEIRI